MPGKGVLIFIDLPRGRTLTAARSLGYRPIAVLDRRGSIVGPVCEDVELLEEVLEVEQYTPATVLTALNALPKHEYPIQRILTHCEVHVPLANQLCVALGVGPPSTREPLNFRDKALMKTRLAEAGIPVAQFEPVGTVKEALAAATAFGYPVVLKPSRGTASRGVVRVDDENGLCSHFRLVKLIALSMDDDRVLIEKYVPGDEVGVEAITHRGATRVVLISDKPEPLDGPYFEESMYLAPSTKPKDVLECIAELTCRAVAALNLVAGPSHLEFRIAGSQCYLLEVAARPGSPLPYVSASLGLSYERLCLQSFEDATELVLPETRFVSGYLLLPSPGTGRIREIQGLEVARALPGIWSVHMWKRPGDLVLAPPEFNGYVGTVYGTGLHRDDVQAALEQSRKEIRVLIE
jgi:biotin carboxylase